LLFEPATTIHKTLEQIEWAVKETQNRLDLIGKSGCRNITEYNIKGRMPRIVIVIDELADLLTGSHKKESKELIQTIVQRSRAAGIHMIACTQRPSVKIVDGDIKTNFPARIAMKVTNQFDSNTILGTSGAEHLCAPGDMLFLSPNRPGLQRIHAPYAKISDIQAAVDVACRREE
jgi:S-DNA-T family DNA segregation ATPase FtsK/SpoIIIE